MNRKSSGLASLQSGISTGLSAYTAGGPVKHFADTGLVGRSSGAGARWTGVYDMYGDQEFDYSGITQPGDITQYFGDWYTPTEGADWLAGAGITDSGGSGAVGDGYVPPEVDPSTWQQTLSPVSITTPAIQGEPNWLTSTLSGLANAATVADSGILGLIRSRLTGKDPFTSSQDVANILSGSKGGERLTTSDIDEIITQARRGGVDVTADDINKWYGAQDVGGAAGEDQGGAQVTESSIPTVNSLLEQYDVPADVGGGAASTAPVGLGVFTPTGKKDWGTFTMPVLGPYRAAPLVQTGTDTSSGMSFQTYAPGALDDYLARLKQFQRGPQTAGIGGVGYQALPGEEVQMAAGGIASLPEYRAGGKLLDGPGDGMSDSIPAVIEGEEPQRAALADGEFVVPADVVSHLGNGSTKAGADTLYRMMDEVRQARTGRKRQSPAIDASDFLPA